MRYAYRTHAGSLSSGTDCKEQMNEDTPQQQTQRYEAAAARCCSPAAQRSLDEAALGSAASSHAAQLFNILAAHQTLDPHLGYAQGCAVYPFVCAHSDESLQIDTL